jgi:endonuclease/exonuclease/phosphatase family metal-dependent hydrolase
MKNLFRLIFGLLLVYAVLDLNTRVPLAASSGLRLQSVSELQSAAKSQFTVATYNIRRSKGLDGVRDLSRTVGVLRAAKADIIGLNELSGTLFYGLDNQAAQIGSSLESGWLFAPTYRLLLQDYFGNGLVSRWPVEWWQIHPLVADEIEEQSFRNLIVAKIRMGSANVHILVTHLDRSGVRPQQLKQVLDTFNALPMPAILVGDLNTLESEALLGDYIARNDVTDAIVTATGNTDGKIDWIISRGLTVLGGGMEEAGVSDHPAYWVTFQTPTALETTANALPGATPSSAVMH